MAASKDETLAREEFALGIDVQIADDAVCSTTIMDILESFATDRDELALVVGGARRLGIPAHHAWPKDVSLALTHLLDV